MFYMVIFLSTLITLFLIWDVRKPHMFPPGPKWYPLVGCALQIAQLRVKCGMFCKVVDELSKYYLNRYGLYGLKLGRDKLVVVYYTETIKEMMTNEDLDGKPHNIFFETRTFNSMKGILVTDGDLWLHQRRFILRNLKDFGFARSGMILGTQQEAAHILHDLKERVQEQGGKRAQVSMQDLFAPYILNTVWLMMASKRYNYKSAEVVDLQRMFFQLFHNVDMFGTMFSHFPLLRFIAPNYSGYSVFVENHQRFYAFVRKEVEQHRLTYKNYSAPRDLIDSYLHELDKTDPLHHPFFSEEQMLAVCLDMFQAGSETTNKSMGFGFLHMVRNPEIQERAYAEIKEVVGLERLPEWEDRPKMPYCEGITLEAIRMFVAHTFGIPHRAVCDTRICGFNIPKETMVIACFRGMMMNPMDFPNPTKFDPTRYLVNGECRIPDAYNPFGFGRHRCMGDQLAKQNLFVFITTALQHFYFAALPGALPDDEAMEGATASVKPYEALIIPRHSIIK